jgi:phosphatidylglycerol:prolipoprotein diacylglycerol transferase
MKFFHLNLMQGLGQVDGSAMGDSGNWYQPLFLWEGLINLFGFLLIFVGMEFVPAKWKRAGDQAILYFIWYGIVRIILEPLRFSDFTFHTTYIMTSLWIGGGILLWLLNGFVFSNFRRYKLLKLVPAVIWLQTKQIYFYLCMIVANFFTFYRRMNKINVWYEAKTLHLEPEYQQAKTFKYMRNDGEMMWYRGM